jgi:hypothetical protein
MTIHTVKYWLPLLPRVIRASRRNVAYKFGVEVVYVVAVVVIFVANCCMDSVEIKRNKVILIVAINSVHIPSNAF